MVSASAVAFRRSDSLPFMRPCNRSRNELVSLPSRNATSGSIDSPARSALAFFAIRWVSITSWPETESSRAPALPCSFSAEICSASSSNCGLFALMARIEAPSWIRFFCCSSTTDAFFSERCHSCLTLSSTGTMAPGVDTLRSPSPDRDCRLTAIWSRLSCNCLKPARLP